MIDSEKESHASVVNAQRGSAIVIVMSVIFILTIFSYVLVQLSLINNPWKLKYHSYHATALAEDAIMLKRFYDSQPKMRSDTVGGDSMIVGTKGFEPDTALNNISETMHRILLGSKEILPEAQADTVGMWVRYFATGESYTQRIKVSIDYAKPLSALFKNGLFILGGNPVQGASDINVTGGYMSMCSTDNASRKAPAGTDAAVTSGVLQYTNRLAGRMHDAMKAKLESEEDIFTTTRRYTSASDVEGIKEIVIQNGDLNIVMKSDSPVDMSHIKDIVVEGTIVIDGTIDLTDVSIYASGGITVSGKISGDNVSLFSKEKIVIEDKVAMQATIVCEGDIILSEDVKILDNSLLVTTGVIASSLQGEGSVYLKDDVAVNGMILSTAQPGGSVEGASSGNVYSEKSIEFAGVIYAQGFVDNKADLIGAVVAKTMACDGQMDCFGFGSIDRTALVKMYQPLGMEFAGDSPTMVAVSWIAERAPDE